MEQGAHIELPPDKRYTAHVHVWRDGVLMSWAWNVWRFIEGSDQHYVALSIQKRTSERLCGFD